MLRDRQTRRDFSRVLSPEALGQLLWLTCRTHSTVPSALGFDLQFRPHPSAGAIQPIHVVLQLGPGRAWERYEPIQHALVELPGTENLADAARAEASKAVLACEAVLLALVAEPGRTDAKYEDAESLVWRDAGVLLGYLSLVSEALSLSFCPLGMTGDAYVASLGEKGELSGVGLALLGSR
jgi:SagB-type dehydrogenase family enzyme